MTYPFGAYPNSPHRLMWAAVYQTWLCIVALAEYALFSDLCQKATQQAKLRSIPSSQLIFPIQWHGRGKPDWRVEETLSDVFDTRSDLVTTKSDVVQTRSDLVIVRKSVSSKRVWFCSDFLSFAPSQHTYHLWRFAVQSRKGQMNCWQSRTEYWGGGKRHSDSTNTISPIFSAHLKSSIRLYLGPTLLFLSLIRMYAGSYLLPLALLWVLQSIWQLLMSVAPPLLHAVTWSASISVSL